MSAKINLLVKTEHTSKIKYPTSVIQKNIITSQKTVRFTEINLANLVKSPCQPIQQRQTNQRIMEHKLVLLYARWKHPSHIKPSHTKMFLNFSWVWERLGECKSISITSQKVLLVCAKLTAKTLGCYDSEEAVLQKHPNAESYLISFVSNVISVRIFLNLELKEAFCAHKG